MNAPAPVRLADETELITKGTTPTTLGLNFESRGVPFVRAQNLVDGTVSVDIDPLYISDDTHNALKRSQIMPADVLLSIAGTIGRAAIVPDATGPMNCNQAVAIIRPSKRVDRRFLLHWFSSNEAKSQIIKGKVTATISNLSLSEIGNLSIPLPPLDAQRRIAAILDKADDLRRKRKRALELLDGLARSIFLSIFGEAAENPHAFPFATLGDLCNFRGGSQPPKSTFSYESSPDSIRLIQIRDYKTGAFATYIPKALAKRPCTKDDVMIGRYGPPLFQILKGLEGSYNVALMKAEPKGGIDRSFLFYLLSAPRLQADVISQSERSAGQTGVNLKFLNDYPAYYPPPHLQTAFDSIISKYDLEVRNARAHSALLDESFSSLQSRAFSGQL